MGTHSTIEPTILKLFFQCLKEAQYEWYPQTPDLLIKFRQAPEAFRPLVQLLGLNVPVVHTDLVQDDIPPKLIEVLEQEKFFTSTSAGLLESKHSISGSGDLFVVHGHWPPEHSQAKDYVHYAAESLLLARACNRELEGFIGKKVLDLGCSSGALALEVAGVAGEVLGMDISSRAIAWARTTAKAYGFKNIRFEVASIGKPDADRMIDSGPYDCAIFNPPLAVPSPETEYPHRDGGEFGVEFPLMFLEFAFKHLKPGGEVLCLTSNPIVNGRALFFDGLDPKKWAVEEKRCIRPHFNQNVARKHKYAEQGIERVELWYLHLKKRISN